MNVKSLKVYATYSEVFGRIFPKEELSEIIKDLPLGQLLITLSQLNVLEPNHAGIKDIFLKELAYQFGEEAKFIINKLENSYLYSEQGLFSVWKWLLAYGDIQKMYAECEINTAIYRVLSLNLITSDYLSSEKDIQDVYYEMFTNMVFNSHSNFRISLARAGLIYNEIASNNNNFHQNEYIDINEAFTLKHNCSITEFLAIIFGIISGYSKNDYNISSQWTHGPDYYSKFSNYFNVERVLNDISMSLDEAKEWSLKTINEPWDFSKFRQKPLIKLDGGHYFPISMRFLEEQMFDEFFYKVRHSFSSQDTQIISFIGRCFEVYVDKITKKACEASNVPYTVISEFTYNKGKRSPDVMIKLGNRLLAVEVKNYRLSMNSVISENHKSIDTDIEKMIKKTNYAVA
jgi:hypothetical protein